MKYISHRNSSDGDCVMIYCDNDNHEMKVHNINCDDVQKFKKSSDDREKQKILDRSGQKYPTLRDC